MFYLIRRINDKNGKEKKDPISRLRVLRVVDVEPFNIISGRPYFIECILPGYEKSIITSEVEYWVENPDGSLKIVTRNSEYILERVYDNT